MMCRWLVVLFIFILVLIGVILVAGSPPTIRAEPDLPPRETPVPVQPSGDEDDDDGEPIGAHIVLHVPSAPDGVWTIVQWQDTAGGWHDIEGWQGTLDQGKQKMWWLAPDLFGKGPFRWLVYQSTRGEELLATSESFYLPGAAREKLWVEVSLSE